VGLLIAAAQQDSGAFIVRLGTDTVSLERYTRTATKLQGDYVIRTPRSAHRIYIADLNPDGTVRRYELISHNIDGGPGPAETRLIAEFTRDSVIVTQPRGDSSVTTRAAAPAGTLPYTIHIYGVLEQIGRRARTIGGDSVPISIFSGSVSGGHVKKLGGDTLRLMFTQGQFAGLGPFTFRLDPAGRLVWLTGRGSTVQVDVERVTPSAVNLGAAGPAFARRALGTLSVRDTARATLGGGEVWVDYGRPLKRGRDIFGAVVPWNTVWRTGANAATQLSTPVALTIGGVLVPPGTYTLWTLPSPGGWKLIINKQTGQWGTVYDAAQDLARVDATAETLAQPVEQLTIAWEPAALTISWDRTKVSVPVAAR
jgi:hypothetical protein